MPTHSCHVNQSTPATHKPIRIDAANSTAVKSSDKSAATKTMTG